MKSTNHKQNHHLSQSAKRKKGLIILLHAILFGTYFTTSVAHAAFNGLTIHSRANCISINEAIAWDFTKKWTLWTISIHRRTNASNIEHENVTGWETTRRNAIVHWTEAPPSKTWEVSSEHRAIINRREVILGAEFVDGCTLYNGWWDQDL